jgi:hypothetical protein
MADTKDLSAGLFIGWKQGFLGREDFAIGLLHEATQFFTKLQGAREIGSFDVVMLHPYGGDLNGFFLVRGAAEQIDALSRHEGYHSIVGKAMFCLDGFRTIPTLSGAGISTALRSAAAACTAAGTKGIVELVTASKKV